jgi:hypothetical protein
MFATQSSPDALLPNASSKLKAMLSEDGQGGYIIRTEGITEFVLRGGDLKDAMNQLVKAIHGLKKANRIPASFDLKKSLEVFFE